MDLNQPRVYFHYFDALGSTVLVANNLGQVTDRYDYDAWGETYHLAGTTIDNPYQYVGRLGYYTHWQSPDLANMLHLGVRFYEPEVGRFSQMDPIRDGLNWYVYGENQPTQLVDPKGMSSLGWSWEEYWKEMTCLSVYTACVALCHKYTSLGKSPVACEARCIPAGGACAGIVLVSSCPAQEQWWVTQDRKGPSNMGFGTCRKAWWESSQGRHKVCTRCWNASGQETFGSSPNSCGYCSTSSASYCNNSAIECYYY